MPLIIQDKVFSVPQFLRNRYNKGAGLGFSTFRLFLYVFFLFLIADIYSIYGGLISVAWTNVMQVFFLIGGGLVTAIAAITVIAENIPSIDGALSAPGHIKDYLAQDVADRHFNLVVSRNPEAFPPILNDPYFDIPGIVVIIGGIWLTNLSDWGCVNY